MKSKASWFRLAMAGLFLADGVPCLARDLRDNFIAGREDGPVFGERVDGVIGDSFRPLFNAGEAAADGAFNFLRGRVVDPVAPRGLSRELTEAPTADSYADFTRRLRQNEDRYVRRLREAYPAVDHWDGRYDPDAMARWRSRAVQEQGRVVLGAFQDTLAERYGLTRFERSTGDYLLEPWEWEPDFIAAAGLVGGACLYLNGLRSVTRVGEMRIGFDLRPPRRWSAAAGSEADTRIAAVELSRRGLPVAVTAEWGRRGEKVGVQYSARF